MRWYVLAPAEVQSGGPELAHQMCHELLKNGHEAYMYYCYSNRKEPADVCAVACYEKYGTSHVTDIAEVESPEAIVIIPEGLSQWTEMLQNCRKILWWMSVDNYISSTREENLPVIKEEIMLHLVQSRYAMHYLTEKVGIGQEHILFVSDYIGENYGKFIFPAQFRQQMALYNPKKGYQDIQPLVEQTSSWLKWVPLINLNEEQLIVFMQAAKVYVDFGNHPGKDRIPREAASCGCCVITNKKGSAAFYEDVPIDDKYKFDNVQEQYAEIEALMKDICENFSVHTGNFDGYRKFIAGEKEKFSQDVLAMITVVEGM